jgi:peptide-methionine (R)-S-oxide reductase
MGDQDWTNKPESFWKEKLTAEQYQVLRLKGTERAFAGQLNQNKEKGIYQCAACGQDLFRSDAKYDSGSGWPSFWQALDPKRVDIVEDNSHGMRRLEVVCSRCHSHLGHVFDDGPKPTGQRYCMNSVSLKFVPQE